MNFEEVYKQEMATIKHGSDLDEKIIQTAGVVDKFEKNNRFVLATVAVVVALVVMGGNFETIIVYATSMFGNFGLVMDEKEVILDEIEPVELDYKRYLNDELADKKGANFYYNYEDFHEGLGMELPGNGIIEYTQITVLVNLEYNVGHIGAHFLYEGEQYYMNGRFIVADYAYEGLGYGEKNKAYEVYEWSDGKKAYFVREREAKMQVVYFSTENYIFQLMVENNETGNQKAKEILMEINKSEN